MTSLVVSTLNFYMERSQLEGPKHKTKQNKNTKNKGTELIVGEQEEKCEQRNKDGNACRVLED